MAHEIILRNVKQSTDFMQRFQDVTASSAVITIRSGTVLITKGTAATGIVLADPDSRYDGLVLNIRSATAAAHTVTNASGSGFNGGGASSDVGTFGGAIGDGLTLVSYAGVWYTAQNTNVTLA